MKLVHPRSSISWMSSFSVSRIAFTTASVAGSPDAIAGCASGSSPAFAVALRLFSANCAALFAMCAVYTSFLTGTVPSIGDVRRILTR